MGGRVKDDEIRKTLKDAENYPVVNKVMKSYMQAFADRALLGKTLEDYTKRFNELYALLITILRENGGKLRVQKEHWPPFPPGEYLVRWTDGGNELLVDVRHFSEEE